MSEEHGPKSNIRYGMVIDLDKCTGCMACAVACQEENNQAFYEDETNKNRSVTWLKVFKLDNAKSYPGYEEQFLPRPCQHCDGGHEAPCSSVCPVNATKRSIYTGIVSQIYPRCIGCRYCMVACPYHARYFNWWDPDWPGDLEKELSPLVSTRMRGVVEQCTFCNHRLMQAKNKAIMNGEKEIDPADYVPACLEACPTGAIVFGNLKDPDSDVAKLSKNKRAFRLLSKLPTKPKVYYLSSWKWVRDLADHRR